MSLYRSTYLGVYLVVDQFIEENKTKRECENGHKPGRVWSHTVPESFCGECGSRFITVKYTEKTRMSSDDAAEAFGFEREDSFFNVDQGDKPCIWISNTTAERIDEEQSAHEITPTDIHDAVHEFCQQHQADLKLLDDNDVDYVMLYGLVTYYN